MKEAADLLGIEVPEGALISAEEAERLESRRNQAAITPRSRDIEGLLPPKKRQAHTQTASRELSSAETQTDAVEDRYEKGEEDKIVEEEERRSQSGDDENDKVEKVPSEVDEQEAAPDQEEPDPNPKSKRQLRQKRSCSTAKEEDADGRAKKSKAKNPPETPPEPTSTRSRSKASKGAVEDSNGDSDKSCRSVRTTRGKRQLKQDAESAARDNKKRRRR